MGSIAIQEAADKEQTLDQYSMRAFAAALDVIPMVLAENSGLNAIGEMAAMKAKQLETKDAWHGVDCMQLGTSNMWDQNVLRGLRLEDQSVAACNAGREDDL